MANGPPSADATDLGNFPKNHNLILVRAQPELLGNLDYGGELGSGKVRVTVYSVITKRLHDAVMRRRSSNVNSIFESSLPPTGTFHIRKQRS